ncbi:MULTISPECIES: accessory gene regulator B family protein [Cohnella]|uniref:Accessory gene regulator B n=1 Tax=Cohnella phaseoli TaxID=456490 RepID=A0A3D9KG59_9BACL|nr:accessory gene regulator B family protein [Cohnella phaseoli]RED85359.1 accessory gene regulator B [Cohnella phaseoli]
MNWSYRLANHLAIKIHAANPQHPVSLPVQRYAIETVISYTIINSISLGIGLMFGKALQVFIVMVGFSLLRLITGGRHFSSPTACIVTTIIGFNAVPLLAEYIHLPLHTFVITVGSLILCTVFAPQGKRSIIKQHHIIKLAGGAIIAVNFIVESPSLAIAFLLQTLTLVHFIRGGEANEKN